MMGLCECYLYIIHCLFRCLLRLLQKSVYTLLAFWMMYIVDSRQWVPNRLVKTLFNFWPVAVAVLAFLWTFYKK